MELQKNKVDAIKELEVQGILNSYEAFRCIQLLDEFSCEQNDNDDELFFVD